MVVKIKKSDEDLLYCFLYLLKTNRGYRSGSYKYSLFSFC